MTGSSYDVPQGTSAGAGPTGRLRSNRVLGIVVSVAIGVVAAGDILVSVTDVLTARALENYSAGRVGMFALDKVDRQGALIGRLYLAAFLAAGVLFIVWLWRARANAAVFCEAPYRYRWAG